MKFIGVIFILLSLGHLTESHESPYIMTIHPDMASSFKYLNFLIHDAKRISYDLNSASLPRAEWLCRKHLLKTITFQVNQTLENSSDEDPPLGSYNDSEIEIPTTLGQVVYEVIFDLQPGEGEMKSVKMAALLCYKIQGFHWFLITPKKHTFPENYYLVLRSRITHGTTNDKGFFGGPPMPVNVHLYAFFQPMIDNFVVESLETIYRAQINRVSIGLSRTNGMDTRILFREFNEMQRSSACSMVCGTFVYKTMAGSNVHMMKTMYIVATKNPYYLGELILGDGNREKIHILDCMVTFQGSHDFQHLYIAADPNSLVALFMLQNIGNDLNGDYQLIARFEGFDNLQFFYYSNNKT